MSNQFSNNLESSGGSSVQSTKNVMGKSDSKPFSFSMFLVGTMQCILFLESNSMFLFMFCELIVTLVLVKKRSKVLGFVYDWTRLVYDWRVVPS